MSGPATRKTPLAWVGDDGGRAAAGYGAPSNRDCVTRSIAIGTGLPYSKVHDMVNGAAWAPPIGQTDDDPAEAGAHPSVAPKILVEDRGWRDYGPSELGYNARLTLEDLRFPLSEHAVLVVEAELDPPPLDERAQLWPTYHLTAVVGGEVHDLPGMATKGYAHTVRVKLVFGRPMSGGDKVR